MIDTLINLDNALATLAHRQPLQIGVGEVDETLLAYYEELDELTRQALEAEIERNDFEGEAAAIALLYFVQLYLIGSGGDDIGEGQADFDSELATNNEAIPGLADDIYNGRYSANEETGQTAEVGRAMLRSRLFLWTATAASIYALGQLFNEAVSKYAWALGGTLEHCVDCRRLNGQVHRRLEWWFSGYRPQGRNLACGGWRCDCSLVPTDAAVSGGF